MPTTATFCRMRGVDGSRNADSVAKLLDMVLAYRDADPMMAKMAGEIREVANLAAKVVWSREFPSAGDGNAVNSTKLGMFIASRGEIWLNPDMFHHFAEQGMDAAEMAWAFHEVCWRRSSTR